LVLVVDVVDDVGLFCVPPCILEMFCMIPCIMLCRPSERLPEVELLIVNVPSELDSEVSCLPVEEEDIIPN